MLYASPAYFQRDDISARTCLSLVKDVSDIIRPLVETGATTRAGRMAGAFRNNGQTDFADEIMRTMKEFGYKLVETDPFLSAQATSFRPEISPYAMRIRQMWSNMREQVIAHFPFIPKETIDLQNYIRNVDKKYIEDAYHSLSIEGYQVSRELIEKVRSGNWQPDKEDKEHKRSLVARGYYQAFNAVKDSITRILEGKNAGQVVSNDHGIWYRQMWMPFVTTGILKASDLIGYRLSLIHISEPTRP